MTKLRTAIDESQKYNFGVFTGTYPVRHKSTRTGPCTHVKDGLQPYQPLQHSNRNLIHTHRLFPNRTNRERTNINLEKKLKIGKVRLLSLCNLDVISLTTASMDISLPSIGMSAASSVGRGGPELYTKDEVVKNYGIKIENEKLVLAIAIIKKGGGIEIGEEIMKGDEVEEGEGSKGEEGKGEGKEEEGERELGQEDVILKRKDTEEEVEVLETDLPVTLSTIPNKYCSLSEAQGLKQLISIPTGNHIFFQLLFSYLYS